MHNQTYRESDTLYIALCAIYGALLACTNLICQKFFQWDFFGLYTFEVSVAIIPYPITFLITDLISELYGKTKANQAVIAGFIACVFTVLIVAIADMVPQTYWSPISSITFHRVFQVYHIAVFASLFSALISQFVDIQLFHFWRNLTKGKHLWLRNNFSTITSQFIDTVIVNVAICFAGLLDWQVLGTVIIGSVILKTIIALCDTPFFYLGVYLFRKKNESQRHKSFLFRLSKNPQPPC